MKICFPIQVDNGLESRPYSHFGSSEYFIVHDTDSGETQTIPNKDHHHIHGACHPLKALDGIHVEAVVVGGIGGRAITRLNDMGIRVYRSSPGTVKDNIDLFKSSGLQELTPAEACTHHAHPCE